MHARGTSSNLLFKHRNREFRANRAACRVSASLRGRLEKTVKTSKWRCCCGRALGIVIAIVSVAFVASFPRRHQGGALAQTQPSVVEPNQAAKARLQNIVKGILAAWDKADVVCLAKTMAARTILTCGSP